MRAGERTEASVHTGESDPRGELVRPFALTHGRAQSIDELALEAVLVTTGQGHRTAHQGSHHKQLIAELCTRPHSLAEISAHLRVPLGVANVLVTEMIGDQLLTLHQPSTDDDQPQERIHILERVLEGLRRL
jgi:hypothetical protein